MGRWNPIPIAIGQVFCDLTVTEFLGGKGRNFKTLCVCGNTRIATAFQLKDGRCKSCGCRKPDRNYVRVPLPYRFWQKVEKTAGCWIWKAARDRDGYGFFTPIHGKHLRAHRVAYELLKGPIPEGLQIDHLCRNTSCVNPNHLEPVTHLENNRRGVTSFSARNRRKTHCPKGHPYSGDNLARWKLRSGKNQRSCRECGRLHTRACRIAKKLEKS